MSPGLGPKPENQGPEPWVQGQEKTDVSPQAGGHLLFCWPFSLSRPSTD